MFWASIDMGKLCDLFQIFDNNYTEELNNKQLFRSEKSHLLALDKKGPLARIA
jgi:hypothetical protein